MKAYVYRAALLCEACGQRVIEQLQIDCPVCGGTHADLPGVDCRAFYPAKDDPRYNGGESVVPDECCYNSDDYPKGPYENGGGEADYPQHCDSCGAFLQNPLTGDGIEYVNEAIANYQPGDGSDPAVLDQWLNYYRDQLNALDN